MVFDSNFNFSNHVSQVIKSTRVHSRDLYRIRPLLGLNTSVLLVNAFVSSRLDYCNSFFLSLTDFELRRLQLFQNSLCRVVTCSSKFSHITSQLKKLHWLPVGYIVKFKIGLIAYKILNQSQPVYLRELIHPYSPTPLPEIPGEAPPNSSSFKPPLSTIEFTNQSNTSLIPSVIMPQSFGTLTPFM